MAELDLEAIRRVLEAQCDVRLAWVFGSVARGEQRRESDVDIAALFEPAPPPQAVDGLVAELEHAAGCRVDLVLLRHAPPSSSTRWCPRASSSSAATSPSG